MTPSDLASFERRIRVRAEDIATNVNTAVRKAALAVDQALVLGTPVDTGLARSNWLVALGSPTRKTIAPYAPGNKLGLTEQANAAMALAQAAGTVNGRKNEQDIWITNNIPYIGSLNEGSSLQAPANFVELAIMDGINAVKKVRVVRGN